VWGGFGRAAGSWVFNQRRWLDPGNEQDFLTLQQVGAIVPKLRYSPRINPATLPSLSHSAGPVETPHCCRRCAGTPSTMSALPRRVDLHRGAVHAGCRCCEGPLRPPFFPFPGRKISFPASPFFPPSLRFLHAFSASTPSSHPPKSKPRPNPIAGRLGEAPTPSPGIANHWGCVWGRLGAADEANSD
jgi:hypothetical protein